MIGRRMAPFMIVRVIVSRWFCLEWMGMLVYDLDDTLLYLLV